MSSVSKNNILRVYKDGTQNPMADWLTREEPLELRIEGVPTAVLMRTPGDDLDLCRGFLYTEGVIDDPDDIQAIDHIDEPRNPKGNTVDVRLASGVPILQKQRADRNFFASSSCGVCGKSSIDRLFQDTAPLSPSPPPPKDLVFSLEAKVRAAQENFAQTGGIHAAALFDETGTLLCLKEDVGRHNAVDKVIGECLRQDILPLEHHILFLSGRAGFELIQKAWMARIPAVVAIGAPSSLAVELAQRANMNLIAFLRAGKYNQYATHRIPT